MPKILIFGTCYVDTPERLRLTRQWARLHRTLNPDCDLLLVDSCSPLLSAADVQDIELFSFADNIGHLSRNGPNGPASKGRDGWGRAFCKGLEIALERGYDYAGHIEGDSLFRLSVVPIVETMCERGIKVASVPIGYGEHQRSTWVETGLLFFETGFVRQSGFIAGYDWPNRQERPTPEVVIRGMLGPNLTMMPWRAERSDKSEINLGNVTSYDWVTHIKDPAVYDHYVQSVLGR